MWSQQVFVALLSICLALQHVAAVVNSGQTKTIEEPVQTTSENKETEKINKDTGDLVAESSESANRREAPAIHDSYGAPPSGSGVSLPVPVYGVPSGPSNNIVYPAPPADIPPPPPLPIYGAPTFGKTHGHGAPQVNQLPPITQTYGVPSLHGQYGAPSFSYNQFSANLSPPKPVYGVPKPTYGVPGKPLKYHKYPSKNFGFRPPKPVYGAPLAYKDNFSHNKHNLNTNYLNTNNFNNLYTNNLFANNNAFGSNSFSNLYSGVSSLNHQYGAPVLPAKQPTISLQYGTPSVSTQYGVPDKTIISGHSLASYGPPQPSANPKPPHPGAPAPPTPPDIKYDGWQPIPGLVSKRPVDEGHHLTVEGSGYHDLSPPPLHSGQNQVSDAYGAPQVTLDISHGNSLLDQPGLSDSYGVPLGAVTGGSKGVSDSYSAPLGTVTGSGGVVSSSGAEVHQAGSHSHSSSQSSSHSLSLDLSSVGIGHGSDIQAIKSIEYDISPPSISGSSGGSSHQISDSYGAPQVGGHSLENSFASGNSYSNNFGSSSHNYKGSHGHKTSSSFSEAAIGLVPPSGVYGAPPSSQYGAPPSSQYGTPLYTNSHGGYKTPSRPSGLYTNVGKESYNNGGSGANSYLPPSPPNRPSGSYGPPPRGSSAAISFQNIAHGSSTAGIDFKHSSLNIEGASALPLSSYNVPLGAIDGGYTLPGSQEDLTVSLDYSHPPVSIDLTEGKQASFAHDCYNKQQNQFNQVPNLAYGVPSADSYTSSLSSLTTNIATSHSKTVVPQPTYGVPDLGVPQSQLSVPSPQYGVPDLLHSGSVKSEATINSVENEETHGKNYGKSVAASFGPNSELVESQSIDLNNIPLQGNLGSYTLQIQSADGGSGPVSHTQVLNEGLLQSILQAIEQPGKQGQSTKYPIILQPSVERNNYSINETVSDIDESNQQASEIREVIVDAPKDNQLETKLDTPSDNEETLQLLDTSNIALYYKKDGDMKKVVDTEENKGIENSVEGDDESV